MESQPKPEVKDLLWEPPETPLEIPFSHHTLLELLGYGISEELTQDNILCYCLSVELENTLINKQIFISRDETNLLYDLRAVYPKPTESGLLFSPTEIKTEVLIPDSEVTPDKLITALTELDKTIVRELE